MKNALLVPGVFFLNFSFALLFFSFFGGIGLRYTMGAAEGNGSFLLLLCVIQKACYLLPAVTIMGIISVYNFLMRHRSKLYLAVMLFIVCVLVTVLVIIPVCYAQLPSINELLEVSTIKPAEDAVLNGFLGRPFFLTDLIRDIELLSYDLYAAYSAGFFYYMCFVSALFFAFCSVWIACTAARWKMINLLLLFIFARIHLFLYPFVHHEILQSILRNLSVDISTSIWAVPLLLTVTGVVLHLYGILKLLLFSVNTKKRRAA
ncbi:MAG: hypothetical protein P1P65_09375 [Treponema sp.]